MFRQKALFTKPLVPLKAVFWFCFVLSRAADVLNQLLDTKYRGPMGATVVGPCCGRTYHSAFYMKSKLRLMLAWKTVCMYVCMYACMYVCMYVCIHICVYVYVYIYLCICIHLPYRPQ